MKKKQNNYILKKKEELNFLKHFLIELIIKIIFLSFTNYFEVNFDVFVINYMLQVNLFKNFTNTDNNGAKIPSSKNIY